MNELFSTAQAAEYLGLTVEAIKYHLRRGHLKPQKVGNSHVYTKLELSRFQRTRRPRGRPFGSKNRFPRKRKGESVAEQPPQATEAGSVA